MTLPFTYTFWGLTCEPPANSKRVRMDELFIASNLQALQLCLPCWAACCWLEAPTMVSLPGRGWPATPSKCLWTVQCIKSGLCWENKHSPMGEWGGWPNTGWNRFLILVGPKPFRRAAPLTCWSVACYSPYMGFIIPYIVLGSGWVFFARLPLLPWLVSTTPWRTTVQFGNCCFYPFIIGYCRW